MTHLVVLGRVVPGILMLAVGSVAFSLFLYLFPTLVSQVCLGIAVLLSMLSVYLAIDNLWPIEDEGTLGLVRRLGRGAGLIAAYSVVANLIGSYMNIFRFVALFRR